MNSMISKILKSKITKHIAFAFALLAGIMLVFYVITVDIYGARSLAGLAYMHSINDKICDYRTSHGGYPPADYAINNIILKKGIMKNISYRLQENSGYEVQFEVKNIFRGNSYLRGNVDGVFIKDGLSGDWRKWFENECAAKAQQLTAGQVKRTD